MKNSLWITMLMGFAACAGCNKGTSGGPGATEPESKKHSYDIGSADNTFTLSVPSSLPLLSTDVKEGEVSKVTIGIRRSKGFEQDVALKFEGLPTGVKVDESTTKIPHDKTEAQVSFSAADDAALGSFDVKVIGHPTTGKDATNTFKVTVEKKSTFSISVPTITPPLKQGESKSYTFGVKRDKHFDEEVTLKFDGLPKGLSVEPAAPALKKGETEAKVMLKADADAALGDYTIKVTGHPAKGADVTHDFKISVVKN